MNTETTPAKLNFDGLDVNNMSGNFVLSSQKTAGEEGFSKVSKLWYDRTLSYEDGLEKIAVDKSTRVDFMLKPSQFTISVVEGSPVLEHDGQTFHLTNHALDGLASKATATRKEGMPGTGIIRGLTDAAKYFSKEKVTMTAKSEPLSELFEKYLQTAHEEMKADNEYLIRTQGGTVRAILSDKYLRVDNEWFINAIAEIIPFGRLSHFNKVTADTLYGNVLIPDFLQKEEDSEYAGMLSLSNCEIGTRKASLLPSIFRAICMNGCIWNQKKGEAFSLVHRGKTLDLPALRAGMEKHVRTSIELIPERMTKLLAAKQWKLSPGVLPVQVFAQVVKELSLPAKAGDLFAQAFAVEGGEKTPWSLLNSLTRGGQNLHEEEWVAVDNFVGQIIANGEKGWERLEYRAKSLTEKEVQKILKLAV